MIIAVKNIKWKYSYDKLLVKIVSKYAKELTKKSLDKYLH